MPEAEIDNPPAFPTQHEALDPRETGWRCEAGMTLRDYFAAKAMAALLAGPHTKCEIDIKLDGGPDDAEKLEQACKLTKAFNGLVASFAYAVADSMLEQRTNQST